MRAKFHAARLITISGPWNQGKGPAIGPRRRTAPGMSLEIGRADFAGGVRRDIFRISWWTADTCCRHGRLGFIGIREISCRSGPETGRAVFFGAAEKCDPRQNSRGGFYGGRGGKKEPTRGKIDRWLIWWTDRYIAEESEEFSRGGGSTLERNSAVKIDVSRMPHGILSSGQSGSH